MYEIKENAAVFGPNTHIHITHRSNKEQLTGKVFIQKFSSSKSFTNKFIMVSVCMIV